MIISPIFLFTIFRFPFTPSFMPIYIQVYIYIHAHSSILLILLLLLFVFVLVFAAWGLCRFSTIPYKLKKKEKPVQWVWGIGAARTYYIIVDRACVQGSCNAVDLIIVYYYWYYNMVNYCILITLYYLCIVCTILTDRMRFLSVFIETFGISEFLDIYYIKWIICDIDDDFFSQERP